VSFLIVLGSITAVYLMAAASPGPNFLIVTRTSAGLSRRAGVLTALGVATTGAIWSGAAVLGLSFVFERFVWLYGVLKLLGGAYLIYLGVKTWLGAADPPDISAERFEIQAAEGWRYFWMGALTNLTNPKAAVFFGSIFTALLPPAAPGWLQVSAVLVVVVNSVWWHCALALPFSTGAAQLVYRRAKLWIDRASGGVMALLGVRLVLSSR
jgi:RhtB (resistance to homoserine/threonine) family protein